MAEVHHFAYGWFNPTAAFLIAFVGALLGLFCTARAQESTSRGRRARWLVMASMALGGAGVWLMHLTALLGFDVPGSQVRFDPLLTGASLLIAVLGVGAGLFLGTPGRHSAPRTLAGGLCVGGGLVAVHHTGLAGLNVAGQLFHDPLRAGVSALIAAVAGLAAVWSAVRVRRGRPLLLAALVLAGAVCGMHYAAMSGVRVLLHGSGPTAVDGITSYSLVVPVALLAAVALLAMAVGALQVVTEEEFSGIDMVPPPAPNEPFGHDAPVAYQMPAGEPGTQPPLVPDSLVTILEPADQQRTVLSHRA